MKSILDDLLTDQLNKGYMKNRSFTIDELHNISSIARCLIHKVMTEQSGYKGSYYMASSITVCGA